MEVPAYSPPVFLRGGIAFYSYIMRNMREGKPHNRGGRRQVHGDVHGQSR